MSRLAIHQFTTPGGDYTYVVAGDGTLWRAPTLGPTSTNAVYVQLPGLPASSISFLQVVDGGHFIFAVAADGSIWRAVDIQAGTDTSQWQMLPLLP